MKPALSSVGSYGVALLGEALGADEASQGAPFVGKAGFRLTRLIEWAGLERDKFDIYNAAWCRPPDNKLEGTPLELPSIAHCKAAHWGTLLSRSKVIVPMGNTATGALLGRKGILTMRGYIYPGEAHLHILPTVHPSFIQRGQSRWSAAFIADIQKAVELSRTGMPPQVANYRLDPSPLAAYEWAQEYRRYIIEHPSTYLAFDIETPGKGEDEDDLDSDDDAPDRTWQIDRIGFSYLPLAGLSVPYEPSYVAAIRLLLGSDGPKVVWNAGFDVPRVRRAGVEIRGVIHDGMVAWHILHTDLPKRLGFVATFTCPWQPAWKHLSGARPAFYNCTDADVELRSMLVIEGELRRTGLWDVYQKDVLDLEPILVHMQKEGMPVDAEVRLDRAVRLAERHAILRGTLEGLVPLAARRIEHVYINTPADTTGLLARRGVRRVLVCAACGVRKPRKEHFKTFKRKANPCAEAGTVEREESVDEYYRLADFSPSRHQLVAYHQALKRPCPMTWDKINRRKKISFGEEQLRDLMIRYPDDKLYPTILDYRAVDKLAGTYIGRPYEQD